MASSLDMSLDDRIKNRSNNRGRGRGGRGRAHSGRGPSGTLNGRRMVGAVNSRRMAGAGNGGRTTGAVRRGPLMVNTRPSSYAIAKISDVCRSSLVIPGILCEGASFGEFQNGALTSSTKNL